MRYQGDRPMKRIDDEIRYSTFVRAPPEEVYDGIAIAKGLDGWLTDGSRVDPRPGGELFFRWKDFGAERITDEAHCPILEAERGKRFVFQWKPDTPHYYTTIEIDFEPVESGTIVHLREHGYQDTPSELRAMLYCSAGWGEALTLWKYYTEHGIRY
ncbi:MAG: hypothetical protein AMJ88_03930 [Anaerolineae bacterium SM23_ 63]|nr:MAG: hypothetical protein AMJ88_03930 [Anaerolineae bacterium SM23_ 63]